MNSGVKKSVIETIEFLCSHSVNLWEPSCGMD